MPHMEGAAPTNLSEQPPGTGDTSGETAGALPVCLVTSVDTGAGKVLAERFAEGF